MKKPVKKPADLSKQLDKTARDMATESYKILHHEGMKYNDVAKRNLVNAYLKHFISMYLQATLGADLKMDEHPTRADYEVAEENWKRAKLALGDTVADSLTHAVKQWSGQDLDYYCEIKHWGEAKNTEPC